MGLGQFFQGFCISAHANFISLVAYKLCRSCPHPEKLHFYTLSYRWKILRTTNPGNPQPRNYFELPSDCLLRHCGQALGSRICTSKTLLPVQLTNKDNSFLNSSCLENSLPDYLFPGNSFPCYLFPDYSFPYQLLCSLTGI